MIFCIAENSNDQKIGLHRKVQSDFLQFVRFAIAFLQDGDYNNAEIVNRLEVL